NLKLVNNGPGKTVPLTTPRVIQIKYKWNKLTRLGAPPISKPKFRKLVHRPDVGSMRSVVIDGVDFRTSGFGTAQRKSVEIGGVEFLLDAKGKKLIRKDLQRPKNSNGIQNTPKYLNVNGAEFWKTKSGNFINMSYHLNRSKPYTPSRKRYCGNYRFGRCTNPACKYIHDPARISVCGTFLSTGTCTFPACKLSHTPTEFNMPLCTYFTRFRTCTKGENCFYLHVVKNEGTKICREFAREGYCGKGKGCEGRHVYECPEFFEEGGCGRKKCRLRHGEGKFGKRDEKGEEMEFPRPEFEEEVEVPKPDFDDDMEGFGREDGSDEESEDGESEDGEEYVQFSDSEESEIESEEEEETVEDGYLAPVTFD
ncbi:hypothetical protein HK098_000222, partial [Nowakowskiella sp. JEL0407]